MARLKRDVPSDFYEKSLGGRRFDDVKIRDEDPRRQQIRNIRISNRARRNQAALRAMSGLRYCESPFLFASASSLEWPKVAVNVYRSAYPAFTACVLARPPRT